MATKKRKDYRGTKCLNCNHPLDSSDRFCSNCGQKNTTKRLTIKNFIEEFLSNFYAYDSKIKRTVVSLFTKPGKAALDFINGKRLFYANPFRFYLSVSLLYFIFSGFLDKYNIGYNHPLETASYANEPSPNKIRNQLRKDFIAIDSTNTDFNQLDSIVQNQQKDNKTDTLPKVFKKESELEKLNFVIKSYKKWQTFLDYYGETKSTNIDSCLAVLEYKNTGWNRYIFKKSIDSHMLDFNDKKSKKAFFDYVMAKIPFLLFISLPFITIVFSIIYFRMHLNYAEHLVFVFNFMSFFFILVFIDELLNIFVPFDLSTLYGLGIPFYFYKALRNFYQQSRLITIIKFVILNFMLSITALLVAVFMFVIVFLMY
ncbi:DUF3667 domain-containing protein [Flavobacterium orientale]|uniref:DUF3667 domain-containing protein n=1 Tax=Flavobacterium orientale TaxID=1756020 RepID=A0A917D9E7_9FLAO|nr:DUF3667 domain-containing protein [Flavobacterium orientale]GGD13296.1 hypothetical protein GCM10011343_00460 [Flavobacterium orientale]